MAKSASRYNQIIERIFLAHYEHAATEVPFDRQEIEHVASELGITPPKNLGDVIYSFRYRASLPASIQSRAPEGKQWIIRPAGPSRYCFVAIVAPTLTPNERLVETKVPDATPGVITMYALNDEQALLARLRYNRFIDVFTGVTCYSLQSHLRTTGPDGAQVETDEMYVGLDRRGAHYVFPVQAKGGRDSLSVVQIEQDIAVCATKFPSLVCRPIAAQFMEGDLIALFELQETEKEVGIACEKHYRLVPPDQLSEEELHKYSQRPFG